MNNKITDISLNIKDIKERHEKGQPVLVGTISVAASEKVYSLMKKEGLNAQLLNAKNDELEASIIAMAGEKGAITLATNMAGRGTDIKLTDEIKDLIVEGASSLEVRNLAIAQGYRPLMVDGINKVLQGLTTLEEVNKKVLIY